MDGSPLISIALCTYNGEEFLNELMDSLLDQSYPNIEIVIVDDCSTDRTVSIIKDYARTHHYIRLIRNEQNLGYNKNFEKALKECNGICIAPCDQDDIWHKDKIKMQVERIGAHELIYHDSAFIDSSGNSMNLKISDKFYFYKGDSPEPFLYMNCVSGHSILMKRSLLQDVLPFPEGFHYDQWIAFNAANKGSVDFIDQCLVSYRQHQKNSTDILALRTKKSSQEAKIEKLKQESNWLKICAAHSAQPYSVLIRKLYQLSLERNSSFASPAYGWEIWKHQDRLLFLLKKNKVSRFFFTVRKIWGIGTKRVL
jgi:glycosyltransferase involved in cell wall biosynthesis